MLQNRVTPTGEIIKTEARGTLMGNRGVIHDDHQNIVRPFKHKAWITCVLEFKRRHRVVMSPNRWTELFFLDEATAFAAGHRPCAECRRENFNAFKRAWLMGNPEYGFDMKTSIKEIDEILQRERIDNNKRKVVYRDAVSNLPDGTFIQIDGKPLLLKMGSLYEWSPFGYSSEVIITPRVVEVLTPRSIVSAFRAGYGIRF